MNRRSKKVIKTLLISNIVCMVLILILVIILCVSCSNTTKKIADDSKSEQISKRFFTETFKTASGNTVIIENSMYTVRPGYTFFVDKGNLKLYADINPQDEGKKLVVNGKQFHMDKEMTDAAINDVFTLDFDLGEYVNSSGDIFIKYTGTGATIIDRRSHVALKFSGDLQLISSVVNTENGDTIDDGTISNIDVLDSSLSINVATEVENPAENAKPDILEGVVVDEYSDSENYNGTYVYDSLDEYLNSSYEKKKLCITAKYIESTSNSGTKYKDIHTGIEFYAFGAKYPYDSAVCNTVTITGTYRGNEKHFNGLQMGDEYPCFVIDSIRKPTTSEVR